MLQNRIHRLVLGCFVLLLSLHAPAWGATEQYPPVKQTPIFLKAADVLPPGIIQGGNYTIDDVVQNDGFINTYQVQSLYGKFAVESTELLLMRINELQAVAHMEQIKKTDVFKDAFIAAAKGPFKTVKGLVTEPVDTVKGVASGIGSWFGDVGRSLTSDDPYQENALKTAIGYATAKRKFAYEYGVDPYTDFEPFQDSVSEIAMAAVGGGMTVKVAFGAVKNTAGWVIRGSGSADSMKKLVRDKSPKELEEINEKKLKDMGVQDPLRQEFLANPSYNPQERTLLVGALAAAKNVKDRAIFIREASRSGSTDIARFMRLRAQMLEQFTTKVAPVARLVAVDNRISFAETSDGVLVGLIPLDYVDSTSGLWEKEGRLSAAIAGMKGVKGKALWFTGTVTPAAKSALAARGWTVKDKVQDLLQ